MKQYPEVTVGALIVDENGEILLIRSHKWSNKYVVPGGHIEIGETIEETLKREVKEETNLDIEVGEFLGVQESIFDETFWKKERHFIFLDFVCRLKRKNEIKLNYEAQEYIWIKPEKALEIDVEPYTKKAIERYIEIRDRK